MNRSYLIPTKYASLLIYGDPSGLTDSEVLRFNEWLNFNRLTFDYIISSYPFYSDYADIDNTGNQEVYEISFNQHRN